MITAFLSQSADISSVSLQLGQVQQQLQQSGSSLELSYVWLPEASPLLPGQTQAALGTAAQSKACISALAAAGYTLAKQRGGVSDGDEHIQGAAKPSDLSAHSLPFGSPLARHAQRSAVATSSSSSAQVISEAFSNLQAAAPGDLRRAAVSTGQKSAAGENQAPAAAVDVNSSVSGLVTPGKEQHRLLQAACIAKAEDTPGTSQLAAPSSKQSLAWEGSALDDHNVYDFEPRLSQSHPDGLPAESAGQCLLQPTEEEAEQTKSGDLVGQSQQQPEIPAAPEAEAVWSQSLELGLAPDPHCLGQGSELAAGSGALSEEPSEFLCNEASRWSIQPPGALSAEPSGCWDDLPDVTLSSDTGLLPEAQHLQQLLEQLQGTAGTQYLGTCLPPAAHDQSEHAHNVEADLFGMGEVDFDLPALDSPEQPGMLDDESLVREQAAACAADAFLQPESGNAEYSPPEHVPDAEADADLGTAEHREDACTVPTEQMHTRGSESMTALLCSHEVGRLLLTASPKLQLLHGLAVSCRLLHAHICNQIYKTVQFCKDAWFV